MKQLTALNESTSSLCCREKARKWKSSSGSKPLKINLKGMLSSGSGTISIQSRGMSKIPFHQELQRGIFDLIKSATFYPLSFSH